VLAVSVNASAGFDPYVTGTLGYDYSYPQCGVAAPSARFGIVGVNGGYPFTYYNSCLSASLRRRRRLATPRFYIKHGI